MQILDGVPHHLPKFLVIILIFTPGGPPWRFHPQSAHGVVHGG